MANMGAAGANVLGFSVSSVTGYDVNTTVNFVFPWGSGYLCGLDAPPAAPNAKILFAQPKG
jgi:hypothetical protein